MTVQKKSSECPSGETLVIRIPFPTTANGVPWKDTAWIEYVTKAALNAGSAYAVGCGAIFDDVNISIDKGQPPTTKGFYVDPQTNLVYYRDEDDILRPRHPDVDTYLDTSRTPDE